MNPAFERWAKFARRVLHDVARPADPCPELADYAADMMKADVPAMALGERAIYSTLRWAAQAFAYSDAERRARLGPSIAVIAAYVLELVTPADAAPPAPAPDGEAPPPPYYLAD